MTKRLHKIEGFKPIEANSTIALIDVSILRNMLYIIIGGSKSKQNNFERGQKGISFFYLHNILYRPAMKKFQLLGMASRL